MGIGDPGGVPSWRFTDGIFFGAPPFPLNFTPMFEPITAQIATCAEKLTHLRRFL